MRLLLLLACLFGVASLTLLGQPQKVSADIPSLCSKPTYQNTEDCRDNRGVGFGPSIDKCGSASNCLQEFKLPAWLIYIINLVVETMVATIFVLISKKSKRLIGAVALVNLITWPILYYATQHFNTGSYLIIAEMIVWLAEAGGIYLICRRQTSAKQALGLSLLTNLATIATGFVFYSVGLL